MASTFKDLYDDWLDDIKLYKEKLDDTPPMFMRRITRAMQLFQRETEYIVSVATITKNAQAPFWVMPFNALSVIELKDQNGRDLLLQGIRQYSRNVAIQPTGVYRTPKTYDYNLPYDTVTTLAGIYGREIYPQDDTNITSMTVVYIPDVPAFARPSNPANPWDIWAAWFPIDTNFQALFNTARIVAALAPYERAFVDHAVSTYLKSIGSANYKVFEQNFWDEVERGKINKPIYNKESLTGYMLAPWS